MTYLQSRSVQDIFCEIEPQAAMQPSEEARRLQETVLLRLHHWMMRIKMTVFRETRLAATPAKCMISTGLQWRGCRVSENVKRTLGAHILILPSASCSLALFEPSQNACVNPTTRPPYASKLKHRNRSIFHRTAQLGALRPDVRFFGKRLQRLPMSVFSWISVLPAPLSPLSMYRQFCC